MSTSITNIYFPIATTINSNRIKSLCQCINQAYAIGEAGIWPFDKERIDYQSIEDLLIKGELLIAEINNEVVGCIRVTLDEKNLLLAHIGMFAVTPKKQQQRIGALLWDSAEKYIQDNGRTIIELQLLSPKDWSKISSTHNKKFLIELYTRKGYVPVKELPFEEIEPNAHQLLTPCHFTIYQKIFPKN